MLYFLIFLYFFYYENNIKKIKILLKIKKIPHQIRQAKPFLNFLKKLVIFLQNKLKEKSDAIIDPPIFLEELQITNKTDKKTLSYTEERLSILLNTLEITETDEYRAIN